LGDVAFSRALSLCYGGRRELRFEPALQHGVVSQLLEKRTSVEWQGESSKLEVRSWKLEVKLELGSWAWGVGGRPGQRREARPTTYYLPPTTY